jgi:hypothetical protein
MIGKVVPALMEYSTEELKKVSAITAGALTSLWALNSLRLRRAKL